MKERLYIFSDGDLKRKDNTVFAEIQHPNEEKTIKKYVPVESVREVYLFGEMTITKKLLEYFSQKKILLHIFNYYGFYSGTYYPREHYNSGYMIINQTKHYIDMKKRLVLAKEFVRGSGKNILKILKYYDRKGSNFGENLENIGLLVDQIEEQEDLKKLMALEGFMRKQYYECFNGIIMNSDFEFKKRTKQPPKDYLNSLISFLNSMIYTAVLGEIYNTHLDPRIGFLHSSNFRRFSLNLDIAEIFKPVIGDRLIFQLLNKRIITEDDFEKDLNGILISSEGKRKIAERLERYFQNTIKVKQLKRNVSYKRLMRLELYKLEKHLMDEKEYKAFVMSF